jgi:hypothetical protein
MSSSDADKPIFVRGFSRSGGTLTVTLLDGHSQVAMSYELYPALLLRYQEPSSYEQRAEFCGADDQAPPHDAQELLTQFRRTTFGFRRKLKDLLKRVDDQNLRTYLSRCLRSGLETADLEELTRDFLAAKHSFADGAGRLRFVETCCLRKMQRQAKRRWGLKCSNRYADYFALWPEARFINVIRDGRDVLASQLNTGAFDRSAERIGLGWAETHRKFREFAAASGAFCYELFYERLVRDQEAEIRKLCDFLLLPYEATMRDYHQQKLTIYDASHLSMKRISKPIDDQQVGRWQRDVTDAQLREFMANAGDMMQELGFV